MKYTYIDGELHTTERDCCTFTKCCRSCGGDETLHVQGVYGGLAEVCEVCDFDLWKECLDSVEYTPDKSLVDCMSNSCRYLQNPLYRVRVNGPCRCDECPTCGGTVRPSLPRTHRDWCPEKEWVPKHLEDEFRKLNN